jgi:hypothetical protein
MTRACCGGRWPSSAHRRGRADQSRKALRSRYPAVVCGSIGGWAKRPGAWRVGGRSRGSRGGMLFRCGRASAGLAFRCLKQRVSASSTERSGAPSRCEKSVSETGTASLADVPAIARFARAWLRQNDGITQPVCDHPLSPASSRAQRLLSRWPSSRTAALRTSPMPRSW